MTTLAKIAIFMLLVITNSSFALARNFRIAYVAGSQVAPFKEVHDGLLSSIEGQKEIEESTFLLDSTSIESVKSCSPDVIIAVGSKASQATVDSFDKTPIITCLVIPLTTFISRKNVTGVYFSPSPKEQLVWLGRFLPHTKVAGLLYSDEIGQATAEKFRKEAPPLGFRIFARQVSIPRDLPRALRMIQKETDVLVALPDTMIYSPHTARHILLASFRSRVPLIGVSKHWVKAGALYCLQCDYKALGKQCVDMALRIKAGSSIEDIKAEYPRGFKPVFNYRTAKMMGIEISPTLTIEHSEIGKGNSE